jgi:hypothetical protein
LFPLALLPIALWLAFVAHDLPEEFDGVLQTWAGSAVLEGRGYRGWASHFWPPLYTLLAGALEALWPRVLAVKLVSVVAAAWTVYQAQQIALLVTRSRSAEAFCAFSVACTPVFALGAIQAENHMLESALLLTACRMVMVPERGDEAAQLRANIALGVVLGLAGLTRYTSYVALPAFVATTLLDFARPRSSRIRSSLAIAAGFAAVSAPWWIYNAALNGSPLHTWQYLNIGSRVHPAGKARWLWVDQAHFRSVGEILLAYPERYVLNVATNLATSAKLVSLELGVLVPAGLIGLVLARRIARRSAARVFSLVSFGYVALASQAFVFGSALLPIVVLLATCAALAVFALGEKMRSRAWRRAFVAVTAACIALQVARSGLRLRTYTTKGEAYDQGNAEELAAFIRSMRALDDDLGSRVVMAVNPGRAYVLGTRWVVPPREVARTPDDLVRMRGLSEPVLAYAAREPASLDLHDLRVDYLIYDVPLAKHLPELKYLLRPRDKRVPRHFKPVFVSNDAVVYRIASPPLAELQRRPEAHSRPWADRETRARPD